MNLAKFLDDAAENWPERPALALGERTLADFAAQAERVARLASGLRNSLGLCVGDRVAIAMKNCPAFVDALLGIWHAGLAAVPINAKLHPREIAYILKDSRARVCFVTEDLEEGVASIEGELETLENIVCTDGIIWEQLYKESPMKMTEVIDSDMAWLFYTSGTTGAPKGAMLSHGNLEAMVDAYFSSVDEIAETDCIVHAAPMSHGSGLYILPHLARGACQVVPDSGGFKPDEILDLLPNWSGATLFMAPTMVKRFINAPALAAANTSNLKTIIYGGGPMYVEDCQKAINLLGPKLVQIYGQGESPMTITTLNRTAHTETLHVRYHERLASVGRPHQGIEVRIADANGNDIPDGVLGEILVCGKTVMQGYWQNPEATAKAIRNGWLHTGDMGMFDEDGYLTLKDRSKDVIISGGSNIYPREVEEVLLRHDGVLECSVVGRPHPEWGEEVVAFIVPRVGGTLTEEDLNALCLDSIARFKRPKAYHLVDTLPKNNYGKILKTELRKKL